MKTHKQEEPKGKRREVVVGSRNIQCFRNGEDQHPWLLIRRRFSSRKRNQSSTERGRERGRGWYQVCVCVK